MQELVMTTKFKPTKLSPDGAFPSAAFCVFSNRLVAVVTAWIVCILFKNGVSSSAPYTAFLPCSLSNTISSWAQYACLAYVSFPLQSIFKSAKVIPVMLMGKLVQNVSYSYVEYLEAAMITTGVFLFSIHQGGSRNSNTNEFYGVILLFVYVTADSFTSQYQSSIYAKYGRVDQYHMMFGVNMWSMVISFVSMIGAGMFNFVLMISKCKYGVQVK
jgi:adenosine 3'-phospho 5'-phosphosulfate transporter B2